MKILFIFLDLGAFGAMDFNVEIIGIFKGLIARIMDNCVTLYYDTSTQTYIEQPLRAIRMRLCYKLFIPLIYFNDL